MLKLKWLYSSIVAIKTVLKFNFSYKLNTHVYNINMKAVRNFKPCLEIVTEFLLFPYIYLARN